MDSSLNWMLTLILNLTPVAATDPDPTEGADLNP
jgi:hypothetical protein